MVSLIAFLTFVTTIAWVANAITVTNTNDSGSGSLRQAILDAASGDAGRSQIEGQEAAVRHNHHK